MKASKEGTPVKIKVPLQKTLDKYGLTTELWWEILNRQGGVCPICKRVPVTGKFNVDHQHIPRYSKLSAEDRRKYIRGICCFFCNRYFLAKGITAEKARNVAQYLSDYGFRRLQNP